MAKRLAELGALQDAITNGETAPSRLGLAGYIRGLFLDWSASPYNPLTRLSARGRLLGYFWDNGAIGLSMDFTNQNFIVKDGTLKSKSFSEIVNFTRTSNATVTRSDGTIGYAPHNLLTFSEQFDNAAWTKTTTTVSANAIASPTSTTTGDTLTAGGANSTTLHSYTAIAQPYTFSIYIRRRTGTGTIEITADGSTYVAKTITADWTRFDTTITPTAGTRTPGVRIVTSGDAIDVWGAQLEIGSTATTYNPTTVKNLLGFSELFDNAAWTKSNSFVQTNLLTYSEAFDNAAWTGSGTTVTTNNIIAPNGYQTADKVTISGSDSLRNTTSIVITTGTQYTVSISVKKNDFDWLRISVANAAALTNSVRVWFNLATGVVGSNTTSGTGWAFVSATITLQANDFYRVTICYTGTAPDNFVVLSSADGNGSLTRAANGSSYYIWGAQLVQGSVAGDYRRTDAATLPVYYPNHNGVVCAEKLVENISTGAHYVSIGGAIANGVQTLSVYAKAGERTQLALQASNVVVAYFNLSTGSVISGTGASIQSVGNGWYRCSVTATYGANVSNFVYTAASGAVSTTGNGTSGVYIFGAQLSDSASLDPYVLNAAAAPTAAAYYGARFDYNPVTLQPEGLLIEEQRANALLNSKLDGTALSTQAVTVGAVPWTLSFYGTGTVAITGTYTGSLVGTGAYPTRSTLTFTPTAGIILLTVTGDVQFAQLEAGAFATSYIPTAASQVTRTADVATIQGSNFYSWYNQNEGSVGVTSILSAKPAMAALGIYSIDDGTTSNAYPSFYDSAFYINSRVGGSGVFSSSSGSIATAETLYKQSFAYKTLSYSSYLDNVQLGTQLSGAIPLVNNIKIGAYNSKYTNGTIKSISYYPLRLSNDVLKGLTA